MPTGDTAAPAGLLRAPVMSSYPLRCVTSIGNGRLVAAWRCVPGASESTHVAIWDTQMTSRLSPWLFGPVLPHSSADMGTAHSQCTALDVVGAKSLWCGWTTGHISCHDDNSGSILDTLFAHRAAVTVIRGAGAFALTMAADNVLLLWDIESRQVRRVLSPEAPLGMVRCADINHQFVAAGYESGAVVRYSTDSDLSSHLLVSHRAETTAVAVNRDADTPTTRVVWSGCVNGAVKATALDDRSKKLHFQLEMGRITALAAIGGADTCLVAGSSALRLTMLRAVFHDARDKVNRDSVGCITVRFLIDLGPFLDVPRTSLRLVKGKDDSSNTSGRNTAVSALAIVSSSSVIALTASGSAVLVSLGYADPQHASVQHCSSRPQTVDSKEETDEWPLRYQMIEERYERNLLLMRRVVCLSKDRVQALKLKADEDKVTLSQAQALCTELQEQCASLTRELDMKSSESLSLSRRISTLLDSQAAQRGAASEASSALQRCESRCENLEQENVRLHRVLEHFRTETAALEEKRDSLESSVAQLTERAAAAEGVRERLERDVDRLTETAEAFKRRAGATEARAQQCEDALREAITQLRKLTEECSAARREKENCMVELERLRADYHSTLQHLTNGQQLRSAIRSPEQAVSMAPSSLLSPKINDDVFAAATQLLGRARKLLAERHKSSPIGRVAKKITDRDGVQTPAQHDHHHFS